MDFDSNIASLFWKASLNSVEDNHSGGHFSDLWPRGKELEGAIKDCLELDTKLLRKLAIFVARTGVWHVLKVLIDNGAIRISVRCSSGKNLLHVACVLDSIVGVKLLMKRGIDISAIDDDEHDPVWYAKDPDIIRFLSSAAIRHQAPLLLSRTAVSSLKRLSDDEEIVNLFAMIKLAPRHFPFEDMVVKLRALAPEKVAKVVDADSGDALIHAAVRAGIIAVPLIVYLLQHLKVSVNETTANGETPLIIAVSQGLLDIADLLIVCFGADIAAEGKNGLCAIHMACMIDSPDAVLLLLRRGASLCNTSGRFADEVPSVGPSCQEIISDAKAKRLSVILSLLDQPSLSPHWNSSSYYGTKLTVGDLRLSDADGNTLLMQPSVLLNQGLLKSYLQVVVKNIPDQEHRGVILNVKQPATQKTPLAIASRLENAETVRSLIAAGADPSIADKENLLPVHHALMCGDLASASALFDTDKGLTGFEVSFQLVAGRQEAIGVVREAFVRRQEHIVQPLLIEAATSGSVEKLIKELEDSDIIDISEVSQDNNSNTVQSPIFLAVQNGAIEIVKYLAERGVYLGKEQILTGDSLLHVAVRSSDTAMIDLLLTLEARYDFLEHINCSGQSALHVAAQNGYKNIVDKLLEAGASPMLDEAAGFPPVSSPFQSIHLQLEKVRRDRSVMLLETFKSFQAERAALNSRSGTSVTAYQQRASRPSVQTNGNTSNLMSSVSMSLSRALLTSNIETLGSRMSATPFAPRHPLLSAGVHTSSVDIRANGVLLDRRISREFSSTIQIYDFYLFDFNGEPLLTAAIRQGAFHFVDRLLSFYKQASENFTHAAMKRRLTFALVTACEGALSVNDENGYNPLQLAVSLSRRRAVSVLVKSSNVDLDNRTPDGRSLDELATRNRIRARLRYARRRNSQPAFDEEDGYNSDESTASTATNLTTVRRRPETKERTNEDVLSSVSLEANTGETLQDYGLPKKQMRQLVQRTDFIRVMKRFNSIKETFSSNS